MNKTHGAMVRFGSSDDKDLKNVLIVLTRILKELTDESEDSSHY
jgi:hypothetical protein